MRKYLLFVVASLSQNKLEDFAGGTAMVAMVAHVALVAVENK